MKRPRRKASKPPSARRGPGTREPALAYKVVELSTVDEGTLEHTVNTWVQQGWSVESVHFAMRESSKRPAMAFVFFTQASPAVRGVAPPPPAEPRGVEGAWARLAQLAAGGEQEP
ncbi:MAG TPA: hypothetical protein VEJ89_07490 [Myxococcaceae bacterium]|jgi:hypothetical protein|nr:hypothetical protein [Myxococcaceae bacterium]